MLEEKLSNLQLLLIGFVDGSEDFLCSVLYLVSASMITDRSKVQLLTAASKIQSYSPASQINSVPQNEMYSTLQCSTLMLHVAQYMTGMNFKLTGCIVFIDAISVILSLSHHPTHYKALFRKWVSGINSNLYQIAILSNQKKEHVPLFLDQTVRTNFADLLTKFHLTKEDPLFWMELQSQLLTPHWLLAHPKTWLNRSDLKVK